MANQRKTAGIRSITPSLHLKTFKDIKTEDAIWNCILQTVRFRSRSGFLNTTCRPPSCLPRTVFYKAFNRGYGAKPQILPAVNFSRPRQKPCSIRRHAALRATTRIPRFDSADPERNEPKQTDVSVRRTARLAA